MKALKDLRYKLACLINETQEFTENSRDAYDDDEDSLDVIDDLQSLLAECGQALEATEYLAKPGMIVVDREALRHVLEALLGQVGQGHLVRELLVTRGQPNNPIDVLLDSLKDPSNG